jgi:hypothetical protein
MLLQRLVPCEVLPRPVVYVHSMQLIETTGTQRSKPSRKYASSDAFLYPQSLLIDS